MKTDELIEMFKKMRVACDSMIKALEAEDEEEIENAMGKYLITMLQLQAMNEKI
ncbi:hypothetical protein [Bacillus paralicheniformis]|uniref:hypothetical protein n=1 Tax=Bacillus paralicheniformis TaxID=1648923 RepID=UPI0020420EEA|nr:hypothetical protein [Bacillus paralicheniformis]MCM3425543.1 hypothetical protein [Bacillus paralicheniformis]